MKSSCLLLVILFLFSGALPTKAGNTPPSCVLTYPHNNAYYQTGKDIHIRVYASDKGGTFDAGSVTKVVFMANDEPIHEAAAHQAHIYHYVWENVPAGTYRLTATATDEQGLSFTSAGVWLTVGEEEPVQKGISAGKGKYLGNIISFRGPERDYLKYWNGVTAENGAKWGSIARTPDQENWRDADMAYDFARVNNLMYRYHALAWGSQYPEWIKELSPESFQEALEGYMADVAERYPFTDQVDVLNEQLREHAEGTQYFRDKLGGTGTTGYDWQIWIFEKARAYFPDSKLVLNDYGLENDPTAITEMLGLVAVLRDRGLIDGFGSQAHYFNVDQMAANPATLKQRIDLMASGGVPVYITELDLKGSAQDEASQEASYKSVFPVFWEHPAVAGITLWGTIEGQTWASGTGIFNNDGSKRAAMRWLESYMTGQVNVGYPHVGVEAPEATSLLVNGEFDLGTTGWSLQNNSGASSVMEVVGGAGLSGQQALRVCPQNAGSEGWHIQVRQGVPIEAGTRYEIELQARADQARSIDIAVQRDSNPYTTFYQSTLQLGTTTETYKLSFTADVSDAQTALKFYLGNDPACVYLDAVEMSDGRVTSDKVTVLDDEGFSVWPNPFNEGFQVVLTRQEAALLQLFNLQGQLVLETLVEGSYNAENIALPAGVYLLKIIQNNQVYTRKLVRY
ncbi:endo-1,4-beta-xylanase [Geofilum rhodophaeum]|uniref:endo-1,4-beta-xylanase n=1 Tax=Geofilum rhodophaeum TaxID=1965019 RepID=UPI000B524AFA|nr:endo-1,4-beta-xylanase [Geofilum rhodophaeum]